MSVLSNSRYSTAKITGVVVNGVIKKYVHSRAAIKPEDVKGHTKILLFEAGSELDLVALRGGLNESLWWVLADVNNVDWPLFDTDEVGTTALTIGKTLHIPYAGALSVPADSVIF